MTLLTRTTRIFTVKLNAWLDRFHEPEAMARQSLRELAANIDVAMAATAKSLVAERLLRREHDECERHLAECSRRAEEAVRRGDEETARRVLERQFHLQRSLAELAAHLAEAVDVNARLRHELDALREHHQRQRDRLSIHAARKVVAVAGRQASTSLASLAISLAGDELARDLAELERAALEAEAQRELSVGSLATLSDELAQRDRDDFVARELARLRSTPPA